MTADGNDQIIAVIEGLRQYVAQVTGSAPTDSEIAKALTRYFVLREICQHIEIQREHPNW